MRTTLTSRLPASQFAVRDFGEPNWVMLSSVHVPQDYQRQLPSHQRSAAFRNLIDHYGTNFGTKRLDAYQSQITSNSRLRAEVVLPAAPWDSR